VLYSFPQATPSSPPGKRRTSHTGARCPSGARIDYGALIAFDVWKRIARDHRELKHDFKNRARDSRHFLRRVLGHYAAQTPGLPAHAETERQFPRSVSQE